MAARGGAVWGRRARRVLDAPRHARWLVVQTFRLCLRHRVTGLAAEIGFFALLSLPPLVLGMVGTLGYFADIIGPETVERVRAEIIDISRHALSDEAVADTIVPTLNDVLDGGRFDIISVGFVLALWSGSRALNVTIDTIAIMYGLGGHRGIIATRALSFSLYIVGLVVAIVLLPLVLGGPELLALTLPDRVDWIIWFYWPGVIVLTAGALTTLFWIAVPVPNSWWRGMPGAVLVIVGWLGGSYVVRGIIEWAIGGASLYGPLSAPIVVLIWLYALAIIMLIGAAFNAAVDRRWPQRHDDVTLDGFPIDMVKHPELRPLALPVAAPPPAAAQVAEPPPAAPPPAAAQVAEPPPAAPQPSPPAPPTRSEPRTESTLAFPPTAHRDSTAHLEPTAHLESTVHRDAAPVDPDPAEPVAPPVAEPERPGRR